MMQTACSRKATTIMSGRAIWTLCREGPLKMGERQLHGLGVCSVEARTTGKPSSSAIFITAEIWS